MPVWRAFRDIMSRKRAEHKGNKVLETSLKTTLYRFLENALNAETTIRTSWISHESTPERLRFETEVRPGRRSGGITESDMLRGEPNYQQKEQSAISSSGYLRT